MAKQNSLTRAFALLTALSLSLLNSAFDRGGQVLAAENGEASSSRNQALRPKEANEDPSRKAGIEEAVKGSVPARPAAGAEERLAEKLRKSGSFGFVDGRAQGYQTLASWKQVAEFAGQVADRGPVPKVKVSSSDGLGLEVVEELREQRSDQVIGVDLEKAGPVSGVVRVAKKRDLIISAPAAVIEDVIAGVEKAGAAGKVLVIAKVTSLREAERAAEAGARGIEVEPVNEQVLQEVANARERLNLLVLGTAAGISESNAEWLLTLADYVGFSVDPGTLDAKLRWNTVARYAARLALVNREVLKIEEESLAELQRRLQQPEVTSGSGIRARVLTGPGNTYDAIVQDQFPTERVPELRQGLSPLLARLNAAGPFSWLDGAGGLGAALREGRNLYPNLQPVLIDAVQWKPEQFTEPIRQSLEAQAAARGIDLWAPEGLTFLEAHLVHVKLDSLEGPPAKLFTMMNALGYNKNPLGLLVNIYNQLPEGALLLTNLYIPTDHGMAEALVAFYERLFAQLKSQGIADLKVTDFRTMNGIDLNNQLETGPFPEFGLGIVLRKGPGLLRLSVKPYSEPFQIVTHRTVEYEVAWYGEDPSQALTYETPATGAEEKWVVISPSVAARFAGLEGLAARQESRLLVDHGDGTLLDLIRRGHQADMAVAYYGGLEEAERFKARAAGALIPVQLHVPSQPNFLAGLEGILIAAGLPRDIVAAGLEALSAGLEQLDVAA